MLTKTDLVKIENTLIVWNIDIAIFLPYMYIYKI